MEQLEHLLKISNLKESEGGRELVANIDKDIKYIVDELISTYRTAPHLELITCLARLEALSELKRQLDTAEEEYKTLKTEDKE